MGAGAAVPPEAPSFGSPLFCSQPAKTRSATEIANRENMVRPPRATKRPSLPGARADATTPHAAGPEGRSLEGVADGGDRGCGGPRPLAGLLGSAGGGEPLHDLR